MHSFPIRPATFNDAYGIAQVQYFGWQETYRGIISKSYLNNMSIAKGVELWRKIISADVPRKFIDVMVDEKGYVVGFISGGTNRTPAFKTEGEINALYLLKEHHGKGLGKKLFLHGVVQLKNLHYKSFCVFVLKENPTVQFYRKFNPDMEDSEMIKIGEEEYDDLGLGWSDISVL